MHKSNHNNFPREAERQAEDQFDPIKYMQSIGNWVGTSGELWGTTNTSFNISKGISSSTFSAISLVKSRIKVH